MGHSAQLKQRCLRFVQCRLLRAGACSLPPLACKRGSCSDKYCSRSRRAARRSLSLLTTSYHTSKYMHLCERLFSLQLECLWLFMMPYRGLGSHTTTSFLVHLFVWQRTGAHGVYQSQVTSAEGDVCRGLQVYSRPTIYSVPSRALAFFCGCVNLSPTPTPPRQGLQHV